MSSETPGEQHHWSSPNFPDGEVSLNPEQATESYFERDKALLESQVEWWKRLVDMKFRVDGEPLENPNHSSNTVFSPYNAYTIGLLDVMRRGGSIQLGRKPVDILGSPLDHEDTAQIISLGKEKEAMGSFLYQHDGNTFSTTNSSLLKLVIDSNLNGIQIPRGYDGSEPFDRDKYIPAEKYPGVDSVLLMNFMLMNELEKKIQPNTELYNAIRSLRNDDGDTLYAPVSLEQFAGVVMRGIQERVDGMSDEQLAGFNNNLGLAGEGTRPYERSEDMFSDSHSHGPR